MAQPIDSVYAACPKCGHAPLPAGQAFPAACPACGVVLAKVRALAARQDVEMAQQLAAPDLDEARALE